MNPWFSFLSNFNGGAVWSRKNLLNRATAERIDEALSLGYIVECSKTDLGEPQYRITEAGKKVRDN